MTDYEYVYQEQRRVNAVLRRDLSAAEERAHNAARDAITAQIAQRAAEAQVAEYREALEHIRPDHFVVYGTRCRCGHDNCPVAALSPKERPTCRCGHPEGRHAKSQLSCADCRDCLAFRPKGGTDE